MGLSVAYKHNDFYEPVPVKTEKPKRVSKQEQRVALWMARQYEKDYQDAVKENWEDIQKIQKSIPGWMPDKD